MKDGVLEQVRQIAADVFVVPVESIELESSPETIEVWDSLKHINLIMALEQAFDLEIVPEEMADIKSVGDAARIVQSKLSRVG